MKLFTKLSILLIVLVGILFMSKKSCKEGFDTNRCPNLLIQKGSEFYLHNSKLAKVPGVNPVKFSNLEEYVDFINWQRSQGIRCPILHLQKVYDTQGNESYKVKQDSNLSELPLEKVEPPEDLLIDATRTDPPYNMNNYPGFDPKDQYIGVNTPLDKLYTQNFNGISPNPMDTNWGGADFTEDLVQKGYYTDNEVKIRTS
jgi:hypothetical protein